MRLCAGVQETKAGTKVSARGRIEGETGKKALSESLDGAIALLSRSGGKDTNKKAPKPKTPEQEAAKGLAKDIKAFLGF